MRRLALIAVLLTIAGGSMAFGKTLILFSEVNGKLVDAAGAPAAGLPVRRTWDADGPNVQGEDTTTTAEDGSFTFPEVTHSSFWASIVPQSATIVQEIRATGADGYEKLLYALDKSNYERDGELNRSPYKGPGINITCRIDAEPSDAGWFWGTCQPPK